MHSTRKFRGFLGGDLLIRVFQDFQVVKLYRWGGRRKKRRRVLSEVGPNTSMLPLQLRCIPQKRRDQEMQLVFQDCNTRKKPFHTWKKGCRLYVEGDAANKPLQVILVALVPRKHGVKRLVMLEQALACFPLHTLQPLSILRELSKQSPRLPKKRNVLKGAGQRGGLLTCRFFCLPAA